MNKIIESDRIVFHGTQEDAGANSSSIRQPSLRNPFFIGSNINIAKAYISDGYDGYDGSIFILILKDSPKNLAINLSTLKGLQILAKKLPKTAKAIKYWFTICEKSVNTFWNLSQFLVLVFLPEILSAEKLPLLNQIKSSKLVDLYIKDKFEDQMIDIFSDMLQELKMITVSNGNVTILNKELKDLSLDAYKHFFTSTAMHAAGRIIKEPINKVIYEMGYYMVGDRDSSPNESGFEYAVLDKSVFESAYEYSVDVRKVSKIIKSIKDGSYNKNIYKMNK